MRLNFCTIWRVHLGGLTAGGGGGKIKEVMHLFSNGHVWNIFAKFSLFSRNKDSMLESMIVKTYLRNQRHQWDKKNFIKKKNKTTSHTCFSLCSRLLCFVHISINRKRLESSGFEGCTVADTGFPLTHAQKANKWSSLQGLHTETLSPASLTRCFR